MPCCGPLCRRGSTRDALWQGIQRAVLGLSAEATHDSHAGRLRILDEPREAVHRICQRCGGLQGRRRVSGPYSWAMRPRPR